MRQFCIRHNPFVSLGQGRRLRSWGVRGGGSPPPNPDLCLGVGSDKEGWGKKCTLSCEMANDFCYSKGFKISIYCWGQKCLFF